MSLKKFYKDGDFVQCDESQTLAFVEGSWSPVEPEGFLAGQAVYVTSSGHVALCDISNVESCEVDAIVSADFAYGEPAQLAYDFIELSDWANSTGTVSLTPGATYYLDETTPGALMMTSPSTTKVRVGRALSGQKLRILPHEAVEVTS